MTTTPTDVTADTALAAARAWLSAHACDATIDLSEPGLGLPSLRDVLGSSSLTVHDPRIDLTDPDGARLAGAVALLGLPAVGITVGLRQSESGVGVAVRLTGDEADPMRLSRILTEIVGPGTELPPEVPDLAFTELALSVTARSGAFTAEGTCSVPWSLPVGGAGLQVGSVRLQLARQAAGAPVEVEVALASAGDLTVTDGLRVTAFALTFRHGEQQWSLDGTLDADLLDEPFTLDAGLTTSATRREFTFAVAAQTAASVDLAGAGSLALASLSLTVARSLEPDGGKPGGGKPGGGKPGGGGPGDTPGMPTDEVRLDEHAAYTWAVAAAGHLDLMDGAIVLDGTLTVLGEPGSLTLSLRPGVDGRGAELAVPLPAAESIVTHLGLDSLEVTRAHGGGRTTWTVAADTAVWFSGLPLGLDTVLPGSRDSELTGSLQLTTGGSGEQAGSGWAAVSFTVAPVLPLQPFRLPDVRVADFTLDLGAARSAVEVGRVDIRWERGDVLEVGAELGIGIPQDLNKVFGTGHHVLVAYDPDDPDTLQRLTLAASSTSGSTGGPSLTLHPLTSPFTGLTVHPAPDGSDDREATLQLGEVGTFSFVVPSLSVSGDTVRARGSFRREGQLSLPLTPLKWVLDALDLGPLNRFVPDRLPLDDVHLYDTVTGLDVEGLAATILSALQELAPIPDLPVPEASRLHDLFAPLAAKADQLPERLKPYLDIHVPEALAVDVSVSFQGGLLGGVSVPGPGGAASTRANATPLRLLLPGLSVTGPVLTGISLWNLHVGEILGGAALVVKADLDVDQFDLVPLAALLALPDATPAPTDLRRLTRRLVADHVTLLVIPEALAAVPVFFDDLGVEYHGLEGVELGAHLSFPEPSLDLAGFHTVYSELKAFFTDPQALLDETALTRTGLDLQLTAGPAYLQLPSYLGGGSYGSRTATHTVSAVGSLAHLLNGLKGLQLDELLQALPAQLLHSGSAGQAATFGPVSFSAGWDVSAPAGARRAVEVRLHGAAGLSGVAGAQAQLEVRTGGGTDVALGFGLDGQVLGGLADLQLAGGVVVPASAPSIDRSALVLSDANARVRTPGPVWTPQAFSVEWWMYPTGRWNYNQLVAGSDVWGSFVFHTTASGAVYCGTDAFTRFTPADLPDGTVELNTWQHFAFCYDRGVAFMFKNGNQIAVKTGVAAPAPWTGMRLGIPVPGSQVQGRVAELRVWDYLRPAQEVQAQMRQRLAGSETGLVAYWPLDEGTGPVLHDHGPSRFDGTATAAAWQPDAAPPFDSATAPGAAFEIAGRSTVRLFHRDMFDGSVSVEPGRATLHGVMDLFPQNPIGLRVRGNVDGLVDGRSFALHGNGEVDLAGLTLAMAQVDLTDQALTVTGTWLDQFSVRLSLDPSVSHTRLAGAVHGALGADVRLGPTSLSVPGYGDVKLTDGFTLSAAFALDLAVTADETTGVALTGRVSFPVANRPFVATLSLPTVPATLNDLRQQVQTAAATLAGQIFRTLYGTPEAWLDGMARQAFTWLDGDAQAIGRALRYVYAATSGQVLALLQGRGYSLGRITQALRAYPDLFADKALGVVNLLKGAGYALPDVAHALADALAPGAAAENQARTVLATLAFRYSAIDQIGVLASFRLSLAQALQILSEVSRFGWDGLVRAAVQGAYHTAESEAVSVLIALGIPRP